MSEADFADVVVDAEANFAELSSMSLSLSRVHFALGFVYAALTMMNVLTPLSLVAAETLDVVAHVAAETLDVAVVRVLESATMTETTCDPKKDSM